MISRYNLLKYDICVAFKQGIIVQVYKVIKNLLTKKKEFYIIGAP